jgi:hypothetical protein
VRRRPIQAAPLPIVKGVHHEKPIGKVFGQDGKKAREKHHAPVLEPEQKLEVWQETGQRF